MAIEETFAKEMPKLGFGLMRLPRLEDGKIDVEQVKVMTDLFYDAGMRYFDTAYVYEGSEEAARQALVERYPRESYYLATKLNAGMPGIDEEKAKQELATSLERTGAQYFDFYLLHALSRANVDKYDNYGLWDFVKQAKEEGKIRHYGFSFHDDPELLEELLTKHPDVEFVQLQINYADWESPSVHSREIYEICVKHNKPVVIMEPVKGGTLAQPPQSVLDLFHKADENASPASWAIRFCASLPGVMVVLSGMSNIDQMKDNLSYMKEFRALDEAEQKVILDVQEALAAIPQIPCTACRYCIAGCPMKINIPNIFSAMNRKMVFNQTEQAAVFYKRATAGDNSPASACVKCGLCEGVCPQHLPIRDLLEQCAAEFE